MFSQNDVCQIATDHKEHVQNIIFSFSIFPFINLIENQKRVTLSISYVTQAPEFFLTCFIKVFFIQTTTKTITSVQDQDLLHLHLGSSFTTYHTR